MFIEINEQNQNVIYISQHSRNKPEKFKYFIVRLVKNQNVKFVQI